MDNVRRLIERCLRQSLPEWVWGYLLRFEETFLRDVAAGDEEVLREELIPRIRWLLKQAGEAETKEKGDTAKVPPDERINAFLAVAVARAKKDEEIDRFRQRTLNGRLLKPEEVAGWIEQTAKREGHTVVVKLSVPAEELERVTAVAEQVVKENRTVPGTGWEVPTLAYPTPDGHTRHVPIRYGGTLHRLKKLSRRLRFWPEPHAVSFILTGVVPPIPLATTGFKLERGPYPSVPRITLTVAPHLSPKEVARLYSTAKQRYKNLTGKRKIPALSSKTLALAAFAAERAGKTWSQLMRGWNERYPQWSYSDRRVFARDAKAAVKKVLEW